MAHQMSLEMGERKSRGIVWNSSVERFCDDYGGAPFHAVLCDPPYHLTTGKKGGSGEASVSQDSYYGRARISTGFLGQQWDGGDVAFRPETWSAIARHLLPGAYLMAFGGTRTYHRLACAIEDAGFELRDTMMWLYGQGSPKNLDVQKAMAQLPGADPAAWEGYGTALKGAWEPIVVARWPSRDTVARTCAQHGSGALNIGGSRVPGTLDGHYSGDDGSDEGCDSGYLGGIPGGTQAPGGRWPANVLLTHDCRCTPEDCWPECPAALLGQQGGRADYWHQSWWTAEEHQVESSRRFRYQGKASSAERHAGIPTAHGGPREPGERPNHHPTVKPLSLTRYLATMLLPPPGVGTRRILVPFCGSGSELIGAGQAGWDTALGIEMLEPYCELARTRWRHWQDSTPLDLGPGPQGPN